MGDKVGVAFDLNGQQSMGWIYIFYLLTCILRWCTFVDIVNVDNIFC